MTYGRRELLLRSRHRRSEAWPGRPGASGPLQEIPFSLSRRLPGAFAGPRGTGFGRFPQIRRSRSTFTGCQVRAFGHVGRLAPGHPTDSPGVSARITSAPPSIHGAIQLSGIGLHGRSSRAAWWAGRVLGPLAGCHSGTDYPAVLPSPGGHLPFPVGTPRVTGHLPGACPGPLSDRDRYLREPASRRVGNPLLLARSLTGHDRTVTVTSPKIHRRISVTSPVLLSVPATC